MLPRFHAAAAAAIFVCLMFAGVSYAQGPAPVVQPEVMEWRSGLSEISDGWAEHDGDDPAWARPDYNDSAWQTVDLEDMGAAKAGWRWFRKRVNVGPDNDSVRLLISGGDGAYELYLNGKRVEGAEIRSALKLTRPKERVFALEDDNGSFSIALRTYTPRGYLAYRLPLFISVTLGRRTAIGYEREALESERLYGAVTTIAINLLVFLGGMASLALFFNQRTQRDYLFLGLYLMLLGLSNGVWITQLNGVFPVSANVLFADPLSYLVNIAQIEFTFSFARQRVYRWVRAYELVLLLALPVVAPWWAGRISGEHYELIEAVVQMPVALLLPVFLMVWYRRGNREAGLLILPSLLPCATGTLYDVGTASIFLGWGKLDFLDNTINLGPVPIQPTDLASLLFLFAIGVVMFFRFTRVSREQARTAAELDAGREIQRRLVPESLPKIAGMRIEAAYIPADEVGGDFYQVLESGNGAALIVVGDVSGKGLKAAMKGALTIGALRALASDALGPAELLARLNRQLAQDQDGGFVTCLCARMDADGSLTAANAGHLSPYRNGKELALEAGLPLGIIAEAEYSESVFALEPGDTLTLLSDGVVEARNAAGELFGFERTSAIAQEPAASVAQAALAFGQEDDITVLTVVRSS